MKKALVLCLAFLGMSPGLVAHPVDQETAKAVAVKFMKASDMTMVSSYLTEKGTPALYVFNMADGFVIVAADDCETPIVGYSREGRFDPNDVPIQMEEYLQDFVARIQYGIENHVVADEVTAKQWELVKATGRLNDNKSAKAMEPLITTKWHQGCLYNSLCPPIESQPCGHAEVGCVAVAMGQIMNYWKYPNTGYGSHSYNGGISADFGHTEYRWSLMPDTLTAASSDEEINAVATLLFHCGVSVDMSYAANGSGAHSSDVIDALRQYFFYSNHMHREKRVADNEAWLTMLRNSIGQHRPVLYSGNGTAGHAFVCDGYDDNGLLHFNWGWGGSCDGYFALGDFYPNGYNFNSNNYAIFDIAPDTDLYPVTIATNPMVGGYVEGSGEYHVSEPCTLTATPSEDYDFICWKKNGTVFSYNRVISFNVLNQAEEFEACFTLKPIQQITAVVDTNGTGNPTIAFSHIKTDGDPWFLLKQFEIHGGRGIASDNEYIYVCGADTTDFMFTKYTMNGEFVESFDVEGCHHPSCLTYDGTFFYCNGMNDKKFYTVNMTEKKLVRCTPLGFDFDLCSYDKTKYKFWMNRKSSESQNEQIVLCSRSGVISDQGPTINAGSMVGSGVYVGLDGSSHLLLKDSVGLVYQVIKYYSSGAVDHAHPLLDCGASKGAFIGKYEGVDALYVVDDVSVRIYRMVNVFSQCKQYRLWRSDDYLSSIIADPITGSSYVDNTWRELGVGRYTYGLGMVFENSLESIVWSNPLIKGNYDIIETADPGKKTVQKVFENGQIVIIKEGKKYNVTGQQLK